jgi:hypothetical protein
VSYYLTPKYLHRGQNQSKTSVAFGLGFLEGSNPRYVKTKYYDIISICGTIGTLVFIIVDGKAVLTTASCCMDPTPMMSKVDLAGASPI